MQLPEHYVGREQTYVKHFFLEYYLERVARIIGSFAPDFIYVDGFSGPWKSEDEEYEDTSFMIAINKLRQVRDDLAKIGRSPRIRCVFIEKDPEAFKKLEAAVSTVTDIAVTILPGEFANLIPQIKQLVGKSFMLLFIDPTGYTEYPLLQIAPLLIHRPGEVIINFMFDFINRFILHPNPEHKNSMDDLFGGSGWEYDVEHAGSEREEVIINMYKQRLRDAAQFDYVTHTRILKPLHDRSFFYLVYGTRHPKGLVEFRKVELAVAKVQARVRATAQEEQRKQTTGQGSMMFLLDEETQNEALFISLERERSENLSQAKTLLVTRLKRESRVLYDDLLPSLIEIPFVLEKDIKDLIGKMVKAGDLRIEGLKPRERALKLGNEHYIVRLR